MSCLSGGRTRSEGARCPQHQALAWCVTAAPPRGEGLSCPFGHGSAVTPSGGGSPGLHVSLRPHGFWKSGSTLKHSEQGSGFVRRLRQPGLPDVPSWTGRPGERRPPLSSGRVLAATPRCLRVLWSQGEPEFGPVGTYPCVIEVLDLGP